MSTENTQDTTSAESTSGTESSFTPDNSVTTTDTQSAAAPTTNPDGTPVVAAPAQPTYTPNFKYKAALQEKELDPFWHPLVKDADSEKKVKEVFTKADAFEYMKEKLTKRDGDYESLRSDYEIQAKVVDKVMKAKQAGDHETVFRNLGYTDHEIIQWAARRVDYLQSMQNLPPEQRAQIERQQQAAQQNNVYQEQLEQMQSQLQSQASQATQVRLEMALIKPDVAPAVKFWDERMGQDGAFYNLVVEEGQKAAYLEDTILTPEQAIARVMQKFGKFIDANGNVSQAQPNLTMNQAVPQALGQKPVIPTIQGSAKAPIRKQVKSIADIKQLSKEMNAASASDI